MNHEQTTSQLTIHCKPIYDSRWLVDEPTPNLGGHQILPLYSKVQKLGLKGKVRYVDRIVCDGQVSRDAFGLVNM
jgi:hypothetical protein